MINNRYIIWTDGSARNNGKPNCVSGFAALVCKHTDTDIIPVNTCMGYELASTSQRGELLAMLNGLKIAQSICNRENEAEITIISDSGYIVNCIRENWYKKWANNGWLTAMAEPVKNSDEWKQIAKILSAIPEDKIQLYQIKGHVKKNECVFEKFKEKNFGAEIPERLMEIFQVGNQRVDTFAKNTRDLGELVYVEQMQQCGAVPRRLKIL